MDHPEAIRLMAVEKYLLNELSPELRRSFEEHLFECKECEFDVQAGYALIDGSKEALASTAVELEKAKVPGKQSSWFAWFRPAFAAPVMALLVFVVGYQNFVTVPALKNEVAAAQSPHILNTAYLTAGVSRGSAVQVTTKRNYPVSLTFDIPAESRFASYMCELQSSAGVLEGSLPVSAEAARNSVSISFYPKRGNSGTYQLVVFGVSQDSNQRVEIERQPLELQVQD
ncbi:MAG TPA: zf-HC2 domain-containing protein [Terriglobales bacterium]|nr:zf-HC2 domain-containing protein [Terriglobales bacterium]